MSRDRTDYRSTTVSQREAAAGETGARTWTAAAKETVWWQSCGKVNRAVQSATTTRAKASSSRNFEEVVAIAVVKVIVGEAVVTKRQSAS